MTMMLEVDRPTPSRLVAGCSPLIRVRMASWVM